MKVDRDLVIAENEMVYKPAEDTYLLIKSIYIGPGESVLELGTGSGIIALHCAKSGAKVTAVDINPYALDAARKNAELNKVDIAIMESDLFQAIEKRFDVIIFNPPYLRSNDEEKTDWLTRAWDGGEGGSDIIESFLQELSEHLTAGGRSYIILSSINEPDSLIKRFEKLLFTKVLEESHFYEKLTAYEIKLKV